MKPSWWQTLAAATIACCALVSTPGLEATETEIERGALATFGEDDHLWGGLTVSIEL